MSRFVHAFQIAAACYLCVIALGACTTPDPRTVDISYLSKPSNLTTTHTSAADIIPKQARTRTIDRVTVSAWLLPDDVARRRYGVNLASKELQAVWLRVANRSRDELWLFAASLDPDYFTADEAAYLFPGLKSSRSFEARRQRFRDLAVRARLDPGRSYEGHILVPRTEGGRYVELMINGKAQVRRFGFALRTPDGHFEYEKLNPADIYSGRRLPDLNRRQLRSRLQQLPPTATNVAGNAAGDPLNIVLVGDPHLMMATLSESGWSFTHRIDWTTVRREIGAAIAGRAYPNAPVSALYVFGRPQDLSFQRSRATISRRNHMRLWLAPYTVEGCSVWVGHVSRDIGVKLTRKSPTFTTHVIDPMVDEARQFLFESLLVRYRVESFGFVRAAEPSTREHPRKNLTGDPYLTDGMRLIVFLSSKAVQTEQVRNLGWDRTTKGPIERGQSNAVVHTSTEPLRRPASSRQQIH